MTPVSYLFVPGDRPDRFQKAWDSGVDVVIIDLEDAVSAPAKPAARQSAADWLSPERPVYVRTNGPLTEHYPADLDAVLRPGLRGVMLPKAESPEQLARLAERLPDGATVIPIVETAVGIWNALELAQAPRVERLAFGSIDLQLDAGIDGEGEELLYARSRVVLASRVAGIEPPLDGVTTAIRDPNRLRQDVERARKLGFGGKLCIHPSQVEAVSAGFRPSEQVVQWAERVVEAAEASATGAIQLDGQMIDKPIIERARALLERARG